MSVNGGGKTNVQFGSLSTSEITISIWGDMADGVTTFDDYWTYSTGVGTARVGILENGGGTQAAAWFGPNGISPGTPSIATGGFHHIVLSASAAANTVTLYVDGNSVGTNTWSETALLNWFTLGGEFPTGIRNLDVDLDDVQIYNFGLSAGQVSYLFNNPGLTLPIPEPSALVLAMLGIVGLGSTRHRRR